WQTASTLSEPMKSRFSASAALLTAGVLSAALWNPRATRAAETYIPFEGERTTWHDGFERFDYVMDEESLAITPIKRPEGEKFAVGNPARSEERRVGKE